MRFHHPKMVFMICFFTCVGWSSPSLPQVDDSAVCRPFLQAVDNGGAGTPAVVPQALLQDQRRAISCLSSVVKNLNPKGASSTLTSDLSLKLLSATAAIRTLLTAGAETDISGTSEFDDLDFVSSLVFGARSGNKDLRINSALVLGNVINNNTICIPLMHLNDPDLLNGQSGTNGRANLLGLASIVAPWAYLENYQSTLDTVRSIKSGLSLDRPDAAVTAALVDNVLARLASQSSSSNKVIPMGSDRRQLCADYIERLGGQLRSTGNLHYVELAASGEQDHTDGKPHINCALNSRVTVGLYYFPGRDFKPLENALLAACFFVEAGEYKDRRVTPNEVGTSYIIPSIRLLSSFGKTSVDEIEQAVADTIGSALPGDWSVQLPASPLRGPGIVKGAPGPVKDQVKVYLF